MNEVSPSSPTPPNQGRILCLGLVGTILGGIAGYFIFMWLVRQGFYTLLVPPALVGLGAALLARGRSILLASICAIAGLVVALFCEWRAFPFRADPSFGYFIMHLQDLRSITLVMLILGVIISFFLGLGWRKK